MQIHVYTIKGSVLNEKDCIQFLQIQCILKYMYHVLTMLELKSKIKCVLAQDSIFFILKKKKTEKGNVYVQGAGVLEIAGRKHPRCLMVKLMVVKWTLTFPPYLFFLLQKKDNSSSERHYAVFTRSFELCLLYELHQHEKICKIYVVCRFSFKLLLC